MDSNGNVCEDPRIRADKNSTVYTRKKVPGYSCSPLGKWTKGDAEKNIGRPPIIDASAGWKRVRETPLCDGEDHARGPKMGRI